MLNIFRRLFNTTSFSSGEWHIISMLHALERRYLNANTRLESIMATLDDLLANARAMDNKLDSVRELIQSLRDQIKAIPSIPQDAQAKIDELFDLMQKNNLEVTQALQVPGPAGDITQADIDASGQPSPAAPAPEEGKPAEDAKPEEGKKEDGAPESGINPSPDAAVTAQINHPIDDNTTTEQHGMLPVTDAPPANSNPAPTEPAPEPDPAPTRRRR